MPQSDELRLCNDVVLEAQLRSIEYRARAVGWLTACLFPGVFLSLGLSQRGNIAFASWVFFVYLVSVFAFRLFRERSIIGNHAGSVATIVRASRKPLEAGHVHSFRYRFVAADGKIYSGKSGWTGRALTHVGQKVPILYERNDPSHNLALSDFRFYTFNFSGLEG
jgi:hypothetical protein